MRKVISDDASLSTDIKSDISFVRRQKELRNLYRDFRSAIDNVQTVSSSKITGAEEEEEEETIEQDSYQNDMPSYVMEEEEENIEEEEEEEMEKPKPKPKRKKNKDDVPNDIDFIIQEIEMLQSEAKEILQLLNKSQLAKNPRVKSIKAQLQYVNHINEGLKDRAIRLKSQR